MSIDVAFADVDPAVAAPQEFYHQGDITVLRDGTWSFPLVVNQALFPFPLYRPGFIVVRAQSESKSGSGTFVYTVEGREPAGAPPLASLGSGPLDGDSPLVIGAGLLALGIGTLTLLAGARRFAAGHARGLRGADLRSYVARLLQADLLQEAILLRLAAEKVTHQSHRRRRYRRARGSCAGTRARSPRRAGRRSRSG